MSDETADQRVDKAWDTPTTDEIPAISRAHIEAMETSNSDEVWVRMGLHHVVLHTTGRKSGQPRKTALPVWHDPHGHRVVVASFAGAPNHPDWYFNLTATPEVEVHTQRGRYRSTAEVLAPEERVRMWQLLVADRPFYREYEENTDRTIPLVRLAEPAQ
jgi:deazaflavin-dependent oxidoreductase (nitroreductase family)